MKKVISLLVILIGFSASAQDKKWSLQECVEHALENNISILQSDLNVDLADIDKSQAVSDFFPNLNGNSSYNRNTGANINPATNQFENETFKSMSASINSSVNLSSGLRNWKNLQRAKLNQLAASYQLDKMKDDIALFVANSYLQILFNKEQLKVLNTQNDITKENINRTQELVDAGVLPEGDLLEIKATDATQLQQIIDAENALFISKLGLAQLLKVQEYESFDIEETDISLFSESILSEKPTVIIEKAKEELNDIKIAESNYELARKDLEIAKTSNFPTLAGFLGYNTRWSSSSLDITTGEQIPFIDQLYLFDGTALGLQLNVPVFNRNSVKNNIKRSRINVENNKYLLEQANLDLESNVYQAYNDASSSKKAYEAALKTEEARSLAFNYAQERYNVGLSNSFDYNQSRSQFENAQSDVVRTKFDYIFKLKVLEFYFGIPITELN
ncbi:MAG: transporter [Bacteroidetes bacterium MedPE-SWsnd-G2]|nr:MAG: transporter [Bacteroidetes bacterium MedPE-SWsnd-G2]